MNYLGFSVIFALIVLFYGEVTEGNFQDVNQWKNYGTRSRSPTYKDDKAVKQYENESDDEKPQRYYWRKYESPVRPVDQYNDELYHKRRRGEVGLYDERNGGGFVTDYGRDKKYSYINEWYRNGKNYGKEGSGYENDENQSEDNDNDVSKPGRGGSRGMRRHDRDSVDDFESDSRSETGQYDDNHGRRYETDYDGDKEYSYKYEWNRKGKRNGKEVSDYEEEEDQTEDNGEDSGYVGDTKDKESGSKPRMGGRRENDDYDRDSGKGSGKDSKSNRGGRGDRGKRRQDDNYDRDGDSGLENGSKRRRGGPLRNDDYDRGVDEETGRGNGSKSRRGGRPGNDIRSKPGGRRGTGKRRQDDNDDQDGGSDQDKGSKRRRGGRSRKDDYDSVVDGETGRGNGSKYRRGGRPGKDGYSNVSGKRNGSNPGGRRDRGKRRQNDRRVDEETGRGNGSKSRRGGRSGKDGYDGGSGRGSSNYNGSNPGRRGDRGKGRQNNNNGKGRNGNGSGIGNDLPYAGTFKCKPCVNKGGSSQPKGCLTPYYISLCNNKNRCANNPDNGGAKPCIRRKCENKRNPDVSPKPPTRCTRPSCAKVKDDVVLSKTDTVKKEAKSIDDVETNDVNPSNKEIHEHDEGSPIGPPKEDAPSGT